MKLSLNASKKESFALSFISEVLVVKSLEDALLVLPGLLLIVFVEFVENASKSAKLSKTLLSAAAAAAIIGELRSDLILLAFVSSPPPSAVPDADDLAEGTGLGFMLKASNVSGNSPLADVLDFAELYVLEDVVVEVLDEFGFVLIFLVCEFFCDAASSSKSNKKVN